MSQQLYSPADPSNPMVFTRVPYEKRLHWLLLWNPDNDPNHVNCTIAMDTLAYFANQHTQTQQAYYHGVYRGVTDAKRDLDKCIEVRALAASDYDEAKQSLTEWTSNHEVEVEHVWRFRQDPVKLHFPS